MFLIQYILFNNKFGEVIIDVDIKKESNNFYESRPQRLCLMCGKCCKTVTTSIKYEELQKLAKLGDDSSIDFLEIFEPYNSIEEAKKSDKKTVENILSSFKKGNIENEENITFYKCKHLLENNKCAIYEDRKALCDRFPSSPWAVVPPGCGYEGWLFQEREKIKQAIRKQKEGLIFLKEEIKNTTNIELQEKTRQTIENIENTIKLYEKYGSKDW